eukprot:jgi/Picre1/35122/NNA_002585.t1
MAPGVDDGSVDAFVRAKGEETDGRTLKGNPVIVKRKGTSDVRVSLPEVLSAGEGVLRRQPEKREVTAPAIVRRGREVLREPREVARVKKTDDDEAIFARRTALKQRLQAAAAEEAQEEESESESSSGESDDYTSEEESDDFAPIAKPVFIRKNDRQTIAEREAIEREELERLEAEKARAVRRVQETRKIASEKVAEEKAQEEAAKMGPVGADEIITDDEAEPEEDYEKWKTREIERLRRELEAKLRQEEEVREKEVWRNMTDKEKERYLAEKARRARDSVKSKAETKKNWSFLQKYYHKGAFFQTEAEYKGEEAPLIGDIKERDFSAPTGEDVFDKSTLPKVMQVRDFGKRSRSKWTHLAAEDTSRRPDDGNPDKK